MAHGIKPYGRTTPLSTVYAVQDMGELAARLGSIDTYDRGGHVIWLDNFDSGLDHWQRASTVPADLPDWDGNHWRNGGYSCRLHTSATAWFSSRIIAYNPPPVLSQIGLEVSFAWHGTTPRIYFNFLHYRAPIRMNYAVRYDYNGQLLEYMDSTGAWQTIAAGLLLFMGEHVFHTIKLVLDLVNSQYVRVALDNVVYTLAGLGAYPFGGVVSPYIQCTCELENMTNAAEEVWIDNVILTQNEPRGG